MSDVSWIQWILGAGLMVSGGVMGQVMRSLTKLRADHVALALDVAKNYISRDYMTGFEKRMEAHLQRIEDKIDGRVQGHD